jgi:hypothetical protein
VERFHGSVVAVELRLRRLSWRPQSRCQTQMGNFQDKVQDLGFCRARFGRRGEELVRRQLNSS